MTNKKKKGAFFIRLYVSIIVLLLSYFTIYAYRFEMLNLFITNDIVNVEVPRDVSDTINQKCKEITFKIENAGEIENVLSSELKDFSYGNYELNTPISNADHGFISYSFGDTHQSFYSEIEVVFKNTTRSFEITPKGTAYLNWYRIASLIVALLITLILYYLMRLEHKKQGIKNYIKKLSEIKLFSFGHRLSIKLFILNVFAVLIAVCLFFFMYINKYAFFEFLRDTNYVNEDPISDVEKIRSKVKDLNLNEKKNKLKISEILKIDQKNYHELFILNKDAFYYAGDHRLAPRGFRNDMYYEVAAVATPISYHYDLQFADQKGILEIYSYPLINLVDPFITVIFLLSVSVYLLILFTFIRKKVEELRYMQEDVSFLAYGDWTHEVRIHSNDEIAELGEHLNQMRLSFLQNMKNEKEARNANKELINAISHDLRTPLTTLKGYLEIVKMQKGDVNKREEYIDRCLHNIEDLRDLSNKMFEYSLVFSTEDTTEMSEIKVEDISDLIKSHVQFLKEMGFQVNYTDLKTDRVMQANMMMIKRILNNLFSNIQKYAELQKEVNVELNVEKSQMKLLMANAKNRNTENVESNGIGLKSVEKIVSILSGQSYINDSKEEFMIILTFELD